jgi:hypothetical protein
MGTAVAITVATTIFASAPSGRAAGSDDDNESKIQRGFAIAPVHLNLNGKNRELVGMGSYIVNSTGDCNGCHSGPAGEYADGGDPFRGNRRHQQGRLPGRQQSNCSTVYSAQLTPDTTGRPEGGASYEEFLNILRTGVDRSCTPGSVLSCR